MPSFVSPGIECVKMTDILLRRNDTEDLLSAAERSHSLLIFFHSSS
jgi:hypothetical protein